MHHEHDSRQEILDKLDQQIISDHVIAQNEVLIVTYRRPEKTMGGIVIPKSNLDEDIFQSKVGLVVKIGDSCDFQRKNPVTGRTYGVPVALGDWVVIKPSDNWAMEIRGKKEFIHCRHVYDDQIRAVVADPGSIW